MTKTAHRALTLLAALAVAVGLAACGGGSDANREMGAERGVLRIGNGTEPKGLDPHLITGVPESNIVQALLEGLVTYHPTNDLEAEPGVAENWSANDDFTEWTFYLRDDARWTNGDPVTAEDFRYSWQRILSPALGSEYAEMLYVIEGAEAFHQGEIEDFSAVGVEAVDDRTLVVRLEGPTPFFPSMLKHSSFLPVNPKGVEANGGMLDRQSGWSTVENYVGNGPFALSRWATNQIIALDRSETYWDRDRVALNGIEFFPIENSRTAEAMFRNGRLDLTTSVTSSQIDFFRENFPDSIHTDPYLGTYYYQFNTSRPPFDDARVRRALSAAIDRQLLIDAITKGGQNPATGFVPAGVPDYPSLKATGFDPERARALLAEAGYPNGEGFPRQEILINTSEDHRRIAEAIQAMWREHLGIDVGIYNQEWKVYLNSRQEGDYAIARAGWIADYVYPTTFLDIFTTGNGNNATRWSSAEYDALIRRARLAGSDVERFALLQKAEAILMNDMPIIPIYWYTNTYLKNPAVEGWSPSLLDKHPYKFVSFAGG